MSNSITTAARRIARAHNTRLRAGFAGNGKLIFDSDGLGGAWFANDCYGFNKYLVICMRWKPMSAHDAQEILDAAANH